ncbi:MAG: helix-turn-helix transcriptional regulator [Oscillospiraceae bacterium]|nr:helix-turn-helix transcriptional regulator [Oscillospiraceae bacterium]
MLLERIRELREDNDLAQKDLAEYLQVHQTTYSSYELGKLGVTADVLIKLARFYKVSADYILGLTDSKEPYNKK